MKNRNINLGL